MRNNGIIRLVLVFSVCLGVILYNINNIFQNVFITENSGYFLGENTVSAESSQTVEQIIEKTEEKDTSSDSSSKETVSENVSSAQVSAQAVKGKIISKYNSPYNAALSYGKVYMKNSTDFKIDIKSMLESQLGFKLNSSGEPQVLIMHTHTTETYLQQDSEYYTEDFNSRSADNSKNMVKIGAIIADKLNNAGIKTLHDVTQHDNPQYTGSYSRAATTIKSYLNKYPSIKIVLDLHRDSVSSGESDKVKLVTEINGRKAAQVMLVMGSESGTVTNFPNWRENLKLAVKLHQKIETKYPTLARPIMLMPKKYNQNLTTGSLLLEFGTDVNTLSEACYSAELVGNAMVELFNELKG